MRRRPLLAIVLVLALGAPVHPMAAGGEREPTKRLWKIPAAAWHRPLGDHPLGATGKNAPSPFEPAQSRTKRGIPVGGIGTGSFMYNLAGTFGPWEFDVGGDDSTGARWRVEANRGHEERFLSQAAFHVYQKAATGSVVKTLATDDVLPAWPRLGVGEGDYHALFPKAWMTYDRLPAPMSLKQFSPFIARNYRASSLPVGLFQFATHNPTTQPVDVSVMFTFPNAIYREDTTDYTYPREGLRSAAVTKGEVTGVRLKAESERNVPETQKTEWVVAAKDPGKATVSYTEDWAADGTGADVMLDFATDGVLSNAPLDPRRRGLAGAVAIKVRLAPGERRVLPFSLAWDFPIVQFRNPIDGTKWLKRYKEWFPGRYRGWDIARQALHRRKAWERGIDAWWDKIAHESAYPLWLRRAALNELYYDVFGGVFWESGCLSKRKRFGARPGQHLYFTHEANVYQDVETFDVRHWETRHLLELFPKIERDVLLAWADFIIHEPKGRTPHDAGTPANDPYFVYGQYYRTGKDQKPPRMDWRGQPSRFVQQVHAYWKQAGGRGFLKEVYPAAERTLRWLRSKDKDGDGLPEGGSGPEGPEFQGESIAISSLYIGALEAMAEMAGALGYRDAQRRYGRLADQARAQTEHSLWSPRLGHYRFSTGGPYRSALIAVALNGQRYPEVNGLPPVLDRNRMASHLRLLYWRSVVPFGDGDIGVVNAINQAGNPLANKQAREVWPGNTYFVAALMRRAGEVLHDQLLKRAALKIARSVYELTYENDATAYWFNTPEAWLAKDVTRYRAQQYQRARAVWELLLEIKDPFQRAA